MQNNLNVIRVSELNRYIKGLIHTDPRLGDLWVTGELSNFKHHRSGHMYFTMKDGSSALRCVFFRRENSACLFKPENGMEVIAHGNISVYEPDGLYQLYVSELEPAGMGSLFLAFEQLKKKLEAEGLFRAENKKPIPPIPRAVAVITSPTGAALQDILTTIDKRFPALRLLVVEALVQGAAAAADIVRALELVERRGGVDLVILARGGGSIEDLQPFNDEITARAIFRCNLPVVTGIGHETDFTIADFVADYRAPTPTAAAVAATPDRREMLSVLDRLGERAALSLRRRLQQEKQKLDYIVGERFFRGPRERVRRFGETLAQLDEALRREMVRLLQLKGLRLQNSIERLEGCSPLKVMARGYSFCRDEAGNIVRSVKDIAPGRLLKLSFRDGRAHCRTERIEEDPVIE